MRDTDHHSGETPDVSSIKNADVSHEHTDVRVKPILKFGVWLFVSAVAIHLLMWGLFNYLEKQEVSAEPYSSPLMKQREVLPPEPRLQLSPTSKDQAAPSLNDHPLEDMKRLREEEQTALTNYGWVDQGAGVVRIPIEEAKKRLLERGLSTRLQPAPETGLPSDASSGQKLERRQP